MRISCYFFFVLLAIMVAAQQNDAPFVAENISWCTPNVASSRYRYAWFGITGEISTRHNWTAKSIQIRAKVMDGNQTSMTFQTELALSAPSRKRFFLYMTPKIWKSTEIEFIVQDDVYKGLKLDNPDNSDNDFLNIGYLPGAPTQNIAMLKDVKSNNWQVLPREITYNKKLSNIYTSQLAAITMPDRWIGYTSLDILILGTDEKLSTEQCQAINTWVYTGGILMVMPSEPTWLTHTEWLTKLLQTKATHENHRLVDVDVLQNKVASCLTLPPPASATILHSTQSNLLWQLSYGAGSVIYCGIPLGSSHAQREEIWQEFVIPMFRVAIAQRNNWLGYDIAPQIESGYYYYSLETPVCSSLDISRQKAPGIAVILFLIVCYITCIGPLNFVYLRQKGKTIYLVWTIPVLAILFIMLIVMYGYWSKGSSHLGQRLLIIRPMPQTQVSTCQEYFSVLSGSQSFFDFEMKQNGYIRPMLRNKESQIDYTIQANMKIVEYPFNLWEMGYFSTHYVGPYLDIQASKSGQERIQIVNNTNITLQYPIFLSEENCANFVDQQIKPGRHIYSIQDFTYRMNRDSIHSFMQKNWKKYLDEETLTMFERSYLDNQKPVVLGWVFNSEKYEEIPFAVKSNKKITWEGKTLVCIQVQK